MDSRLVDRLGFSRPNTYVSIILPAYDRALVFRIKQRLNIGFERFIYGQLPITSGQTLATYAGGTTTAPAAGIFPSLSYTQLNAAMEFSAPTINGVQLNTFDTTDIWYTQYDQANFMFEYDQWITPAWTRVAVSIPNGTGQSGFQNNKVQGGVGTYNAAFGYKRGHERVFQVPGVHYGWLYGNDTNLNVNTRVVFTYAEYEIQIPTDPNVIFDAIEGNIPVRQTNLPLQSPNQQFLAALGQNWGKGFQGFPIYPNSVAGRKQAIGDPATGKPGTYKSILANVPATMF